jgi:hypothetical protein
MNGSRNDPNGVVAAGTARQARQCAVSAGNRGGMIVLTFLPTDVLNSIDTTRERFETTLLLFPRTKVKRPVARAWLQQISAHSLGTGAAEMRFDRTAWR